MAACARMVARGIESPHLSLGFIMRFFGVLLVIGCLWAACATDQGGETKFDHKAVLKEMKVADMKSGEGSGAEIGDRLHVSYVGKFENGKVFDASKQRGHDFSFRLGKREVIPGWDAGLVGMKQGGKRKLTIPPHLAYGARGMGSVIPPNSILIFEVELLKITQDQ